ncbi:MAG: sulfatase-like hydrolase/transferase, partial [Muribaculaceae bacterium]|nr:sulfatase-like hydrolase/transferase [Muribaculaceae bacterium]
LASLAAESSSIVFRKMQAQVNHGRSSDGQFIYNTGLLPLRDNVVAKRYPSADYPSVAKALGYECASEVVGEKPTFYNHSITNLSYGYSGFVPATDEWLSDRQILANAADEISRLRQPFYCEITTLDMHDPYNHAIDEPTAISSAHGFDKRDLNYYEQVHIFDSLLADFIKSLKAKGLYDNSVIVIASDHEPRKSALSENGPISSDIFFMILNSGLPGGLKSDRIIGQVDVMPTIIDVMGVSGYKYPGLGHSVIAEPDFHGAVDASGLVHGNPADTGIKHLEESWQVSAMMIEGGYFRNNSHNE